MRQLIIGQGHEIFGHTSHEKYYAASGYNSIKQTNATIDALMIFAKHGQVCALSDPLDSGDIMKWAPEIIWSEVAEKAQQLNMSLATFIITGNIGLRSLTELDSSSPPKYWKQQAGGPQGAYDE